MNEVYIHAGFTRDSQPYVKLGCADRRTSSARIRKYAKDYDLEKLVHRVWTLSLGQDKFFVEKAVKASLLRMGFEVLRDYKSNTGAIAKEIYVTSYSFDDYYQLFKYARRIASATIDYCVGGQIDKHQIGKINCEELSRFDDLSFHSKLEAIESFLSANEIDSELTEKFPGWYELSYTNAHIYKPLKGIQESTEHFDLTLAGKINEKTVEIFKGPFFEQENVTKFYIRDPRSLAFNSSLTEMHQSIPAFDCELATQNFRLLEAHRAKIDYETTENSNQTILDTNWKHCFEYHFERIQAFFSALYKLSQWDVILLVNDTQNDLKAIELNSLSTVELKESCFIIDYKHVVSISRLPPDELPENYFNLHHEHGRAQSYFLAYLDEIRRAEKDKEAMITLDCESKSYQYFFKKIADLGYQFEQAFNHIDNSFNELFMAIGRSIIVNSVPFAKLSGEFSTDVKVFQKMMENTPHA